MSDTGGPYRELYRLPRLKAMHHIADYVELLTLATADGEFSEADLIERWDERDDLGEEPPTPNEDDAVEGDGDGPLDAPTPEPGAVRSAEDDRRRRLAFDVFEHLAYRAQQFGDDYPFTLETDPRKFLNRRSEPSHGGDMYVFLLLASSLRYIAVDRQQVLTRGLEQLATRLIAAMLPTFQVHTFGTSEASEDSDQASAHYVGKLWDKLQVLADDVREELLLKETDFNPGDSGDLGLDTVAWAPLGDRERGLPVIFAQSTCTADWKRKQHESGANWKRYMSESAPRGNMLVIPYCFRAPNGGWYDAKWPTFSVLMDRVRLFWVMKNVTGMLPVPGGDLVNDARGYRAPPV